MNHVQARDLRTMSAISIHGLRRPLRDHEPCPFRGAGGNRDLIEALDRLLEPGDDQDDHAATVAEAMVGAWIYDAMARRFLDGRRGALPQFAGKIKRAVNSFEAIIR